MASKALMMIVFVLVTLVVTSPLSTHANRGLPTSIFLKSNGLVVATAMAARDVSKPSDNSLRAVKSCDHMHCGPGESCYCSPSGCQCCEDLCWGRVILSDLKSLFA